MLKEMKRSTSKKTIENGDSMEPAPLVFKHDQAWINLFVGGEIYPVQLQTLIAHDTGGNYFRERIVRTDNGIKVVNGIQWDASPNHIKNRLDVDRDGALFREVLQYMRNGKKCGIPTDKYVLQQLVCEADFYGLPEYRRMLTKSLWKMTGKATYYACYSDSD